MTTNTFDRGAMPQEVKERDQWLMWDDSAEMSRRPHWSGNFNVSWSDPESWHSFESAAKAAESRDSWGVGYVCAADNPDYVRGIVGVIDIDGAYGEDGRAADWVPSIKPFVDRGAYIERSPSGEGLHIPIVGVERPEWWSDVQRPGDEHVGVDLLTHKFCTFTGDTFDRPGEDVAEWGEWVADWLATAAENLTGENPRADSDEHSGASSGGTTDEEWMDADLVESALSEIDPDVGYQTWRDVGFALGSFFDSQQRALSVFKDWSRDGSKWDTDAERLAESIIQDSGKWSYSIATVVKFAKESGWSPPQSARQSTATDGGAAAATPQSQSGPAHDADGLAPPSVVGAALTDPYGRLSLPEDEDGERPTVYDMRRGEKARYTWDVLKDTDHSDVLGTDAGRLLAFDRETGVWDGDGEQRLRELGRRALRGAYDESVLNQLVDETHGRHRVDETDLGTPRDTVATPDGLLDLKDRSKRPIKREDYAVRKIEAPVDLDAEPPEIFMDYLKESVPDEADRKKLQEYAGYCLLKDRQPYGKALFLVGPTDSGKSQFIDVLRYILGGSNVSNESLKNLVETRWGEAQLAGKFVNFRHEVTPGGVGNIEEFKQLTGGGNTITVERKGEQKFDLTVTQKFVFATNEFPEVDNADEAFFNRLLFVSFPYSVPESDQIDDLAAKMVGRHPDTPDDRAAGVLNWMLDGLDRLLENEKFGGERLIGEKENVIRQHGDAMDRFVHSCLELTGHPGDMVPKRQLYDLAVAFARGINKGDDVPAWDGGKFTTTIKDLEGVGDTRSRKLSTPSGSGRPVFTGVRVTHGPTELDVDVDQVWWDSDPPDFDEGNSRRLDNY